MQLSDDVKQGANVTSVALDKFGNDVEDIIQHFRHDVAIAWVQAKPYLEHAVIVIGGVSMAVAEIAEITQLYAILDLASA